MAESTYEVEIEGPSMSKDELIRLEALTLAMSNLPLCQGDSPISATVTDVLQTASTFEAYIKGEN
ncbi:MAG: hypothetical protein ABWY25_06070 [Paenisporosarcina sp.]